MLVERIRQHFPIVIIDCAGKLDICSKASNTDGLIVVHREGDLADSVTAHWIQNYGRNVFQVSPGEIPGIIKAENGFILSRKKNAAERTV